jgi:cytidine deaminase
MSDTLLKALKELPEPLQPLLNPIVTSPSFSAMISASQFQELLNQSQMQDNELRLALLPLAASYSYAPISEFFVGAIARGLSGNLYFGANMEFSGAQMGQTVHAEQSAISHAWMKGELGIKDMTINFSPCGHCRQFMNELSTANELMIQLPKRDEMSLQRYLPESFGPGDLGIEIGLMAKEAHQFTLNEKDTLLKQALGALNRSHAPYSGDFSGVAILSSNGQIYVGSYAENAAFNPSLPPLQVALVQMQMGSESFTNICNVALVETSNGKISHLADTQATLDVINPDIPLSYCTV